MSTDELKQALRDGDLDRARALAIAQVKAKPGDPGARSLLFQISAVEGDWKRAESQLDMVGTLDNAVLDFVQDYKAAIAAEAVRAEVMAGRTTPPIFGEPGAWVAKMTEALRLDVGGAAEAAHDLRNEALSEAPAVPGTVNDTPFEWIADADMRFGPILECVLNGEYHWVPFEVLSKLDFEPPRDLRDLVWAVGIATFANGGSWPLMIPARYPGSDRASGGEAGHALARRTDWHTLHGDHAAGSGQRMLATEAEDIPLLELRSLVLETAAPEAGADAPADGG